MRIISGSLKGRQLKFPNGIRPTKNLVRKAIFDITGEVIKGGRVLELFSGSGAVGIEAFSYGAKEVVFVDNDFNCLKVIEENLKSLGIASYYIFRMDSLDAIGFLAKKGLSFDFIFLDPPYNQGLAKNCLIKLETDDKILQHFGLAVIEHHKSEKLPQTQGSLMLYKDKSYGDTVLSIYMKGKRQ